MHLLLESKFVIKRTIYAIIGALIVLMIFAYFFPYQANANKEKPLIFVVDPTLQKPLIVYGPYAKPTPTPQKVVDTKTGGRSRILQPTPKPREDKPTGYGTGEIQDLIRKYAQQFKIEPSSALCIAKLESNFNPNSKNKSSSASGIFQWIKSSWLSQPEGKQGISVFDADANIRAAVRYMAEKRSTRPWTVHTKCPPVTPIN